MTRRVLTAGFCAMLAFGINIAAQKKETKKPSKQEEKPLSETMKAIPAPFQSLKKNLDARDASAATKDAQSLADLFKATDSTWAKAKFADASVISKDAQAAANQIAVAVKANKFEDAAAPYSVLVKSCIGCHTVHRERLPDGTYKMK